MIDIVERLRRINGWTNEPDASPVEAADEIERLRRDKDQLIVISAGEIAQRDTEIKRLHKEIERLLVIEQQLWEKYGVRHKPGPDDYPPGWVTGETP